MLDTWVHMELESEFHFITVSIEFSPQIPTVEVDGWIIIAPSRRIASRPFPSSFHRPHPERCPWRYAGEKCRRLEMMKRKRRVRPQPSHLRHRRTRWLQQGRCTTRRRLLPGCRGHDHRDISSSPAGRQLTSQRRRRQLTARSCPRFSVNKYSVVRTISTNPMQIEYMYGYWCTLTNDLDK